MKALLFVILAHFVLSDHHMEAENRRLRHANRALQQALKAMTSQESAVGKFGGLRGGRQFHEENAVGMKSGHHERGDDSDEFALGDWRNDHDELALADSMESSSSDEEVGYPEEEIGARRRRRRRKRRRPAPQPKPASKPKTQPKKTFKMVKPGHECSENDHEKYLGKFDTVEECADACKARKDEVCHTFIYGNSDYKKGWCWDEGVESCPDDKWEDDKYDFYVLNRAEAEYEVGYEHHHEDGVGSGHHHEEGVGIRRRHRGGRLL